MTVNVDGHSDSATIINSLSASYSGSTLTINVNGRSASTTITSSADALKGTLNIQGLMIGAYTDTDILSKLVLQYSAGAGQVYTYRSDDFTERTITAGNVILSHARNLPSKFMNTIYYNTSYRLQAGQVVYISDLDSSVSHPEFEGTGTGYIILYGIFSGDASNDERYCTGYLSNYTSVSSIPRSEIRIHVIDGKVVSLFLEINGSVRAGSAYRVYFNVIGAEISY